MSGFGVSALTSSAIVAVKTATARRAYLQDYLTKHTLITVDASIKETHVIKAPPTKFPIETGDMITDNFTIEPQELDMEGIISDDPVSIVSSIVTSALSTVLPPTGIIAGGAAVAVFNALSGSTAPSIANFNQFVQIVINKRPLNVYTTLNFYKSMWMSELRVIRDSRTGAALSFTAHFVQIILVQPQTVNIAKYSSPGTSTPLANHGGSSTSESNIFSAEFNKGRVAGNFQGAGSNVQGPAFGK